MRDKAKNKGRQIDAGESVLGRRYRDAVTGFEGVAVSGHDYLQGCRRITLERADKEGKPESFVFDEPQLIDVGAGVQTKAAALTGGPHDHDSAIDRH